MQTDRSPLTALPGRRRFQLSQPGGFGWTGPLLGLLLFLAFSGLSRMALGWIAGAGLAALLGGMLERFIRQMRYQAEHDALTGMNNRRPFERDLHNTCRSQPASLLFIELDDFGQVNKRFGHLAGDLALLSVSRLLSQAVRRGGRLARWGWRGARRFGASGRICTADRQATEGYGLPLQLNREGEGPPWTLAFFVIGPQ